MPAKSRILMLITRLVYAAYAALAVYSSFEAQKIFKGKQTDVQDGEYYYCHGASGESSCRMPMRLPLLTVFFPLWQVVAQAPLRARERAVYRLAQLGVGLSSVPGAWAAERNTRSRLRCDCSQPVLGGCGAGGLGG